MDWFMDLRIGSWPVCGGGYTCLGKKTVCVMAWWLRNVSTNMFGCTWMCRKQLSDLQFWDGLESPYGITLSRFLHWDPFDIKLCIPEACSKLWKHNSIVASLDGRVCGTMGYILLADSSPMIVDCGFLLKWLYNHPIVSNKQFDSNYCWGLSLSCYHSAAISLPYHYAEFNLSWNSLSTRKCQESLSWTIPVVAVFLSFTSNEAPITKIIHQPSTTNWPSTNHQ